MRGKRDNEGLVALKGVLRNVVSGLRRKLERWSPWCCFQAYDACISNPAATNRADKSPYHDRSFARTLGLSSSYHQYSCKGLLLTLYLLIPWLFIGCICLNICAGTPQQCFCTQMWLLKRTQIWDFNKLWPLMDGHLTQMLGPLKAVADFLRCIVHLAATHT